LILTKHDNTNKLADYYLTPSKSMSEATGQSSDPIKSIFLDEINFEPLEECRSSKLGTILVLDFRGHFFLVLFLCYYFMSYYITYSSAIK
jgi:hypothetical protein